MKFEKFICWDPIEFNKIAHTEAEASPDDIFLSIHTDNKLNLSIHKSKSKEVSYKKFLTEFLEGDYGNNVSVVIEGESGSGKSHLVQWLRLHIPKNNNRYILTIPKSQTNLHNILKKLILILPTEIEAEYSEKLKRTDTGLKNNNERIYRFLTELSNAILNDISYESNEDEKELEEELFNQLPNLFSDPYFINNYFNSNATINNIISLIFDNSAINRNSDKKQEFTVETLPLSNRDYTKVSETTRESLDFINNEEIKPIALKIINRNIDKAISRTLNFTPDDLIELMLEIRKYLRYENKELIFLIEDFAQLQGVDTALLQVLTEEGRDDELCSIRWAMAVTTGYFDKLEETVRSRIKLKINMDSLWDQNNKTKQDDYILNLASKYLNAVRLGSQNISTWYSEYNTAEQTLIPNACDKCTHKTICQESFEKVEEIGLYPFNKTSLLTMARQADKENINIFRPRVFLNKVLYRNLNQHTKEMIAEGNYPDITLLEDFSENRLNTEQLHSLEQKDNINYDRRRTLLELWSNSKQLVNLHENIHLAFNIPIVNNLETIKKIEQIEVVDSPIAINTIKPVENPILNAIENWGRGSILRDGEKNQVSKLIYNMIDNYIQWDLLSVSKSYISPLFTAGHIYFIGQQTSKKQKGFILEIENTNENAIVLKTLYIINNKKQLPDNLDYLVMLQCKIKEWSFFIIQEINKYFAKKQNWNPFQATIELLALETIMAGKDLKIKNLFSDTNMPDMFSSDLNNLIKSTYSNNFREKVLQEIFKKSYSGRKGGSLTDSFIDVEKVSKVVKQLKKNYYRLLQDPSQEERREFNDLKVKYQKWQELFSHSSNLELEERFLLLDKLTNKIEISDIGQHFRNKIKELQDKLKNSGLKYQLSQLDTLMNCNLQQAKNAMENTFKLKDTSQDEIFTELFPSRKDDAIQFIKLISVYEDYLQTAESNIKSRTDEFNRQSDTKEIVNEINDYINHIDNNLNKIKGDNNAS